MENTSRRQFFEVTGKGVLGGAVLFAVGSIEGCTPAGAWAMLEQWVPVGLAAFDGVALVVDAMFTAIASTVDALWAAVANAVSLYQHTTDPTKTALDKVIASLDALAGGLTQALAALPISIPAGVLAASKAVIALTIATLKSIRDKIQPPGIQAQAGIYQAATVSPASSTKDYISKVNAICATNGVAFRVK